VKRKPVDVVALVLAAGLAGAVLGILLATTVQIVSTGRGPEVELSDNATQVLVGTVGALTGLLGGYMGSRRPEPPPDPGEPLEGTEGLEVPDDKPEPG
jgi:hypothetical protein